MMESYLFYIGKSALAAGAFYLAYLVLFQNRKQFVFNRIYLPVSLALSFVIPLITFTTVKYIEAPATDANSFAYLGSATVTTEIYSEAISVWPHYLFGLYLLGIAGFLFHLLAGHFNAIRMIRESRMGYLFGSQVHVTQKDIHPFSFFNKIVVSEKTLNCPNLEMIVSHESIHVKENHTLDILFTEILFLLQWFNPFAWLIKDAVKNNLEYKTDNQIVKTNDAKTYQLAMVALADKKGVAPFLTALNGSQLKNRIIMMKKKTENRFVLLKQLIVLPLLAVLIMGLSNKEVKTEFVQQQKENTEIQPEMQNGTSVSGKITNEKGEPLKSVAVLIKGKPVGTISNDSGNYLIKLENENETLIFVMQGYEKQEIAVDGKQEINVQLKPTGSEKSIKISPIPSGSNSGAFTSSVKTDTTTEPLYIVDGKEVKHIETISPDDIQKIDVHKGKSGTELYSEKGKNGAVLITTWSGNKSGLYSRAGQIEIKGKVISLHDRKPIPDATILFTVDDTKSGTVSNITGNFSIQAGDSIVFLEFLSEGYLKKEFAWDGSKELLVEMEPDKNSTIPDKTAEKTKWGKMLRKAGIERYPEGKEPIVIQDGYETLHNANDISSLYNPIIIKSIRFKKNTNIDIKRKELAKNGFIEIKTTLPKQGKKLYIIDGKEVFLKNQKPSVYIYPKQLQEMKELSKDEAVKKYGNKAKHGAFEITTKSNTLTSETGVSRANNPLIVIDGMITGYKSIDHINPADIQSVTILKDEKAAGRYGVKGKDGVIEITMKPVRIYTELQLRKFMANKIRYPVLAHKSNLEKTVSLSVKIDKEGKISVIADESLATNFTLDEIVVVGYKSNGAEVTGYGSKNAAGEAQKVKEQLFTDETKRVINKIPKLDIEKFKGKTIGITVKFVLQ